MQVFVPFPEPIRVVQVLDSRRRNKQIIETEQILQAIGGFGKGWINHPIVKMYSPYADWLLHYHGCFCSWKIGDPGAAQIFNDEAMKIIPPFLTPDFCDQHKRRLYTKAPDLYPQFSGYGKSEENWYYIGGQIIKYIKGKRI